MTEFPSNLDNRELWLASEDEASAEICPKFPSELTYMEELAQQLSAHALLERNQIRTKIPPNLEQVRSANLYSSVGPPRTGFTLQYSGSTYIGHNLYASGCGDFRFGSRPAYHFRPIKPARAQVESLVGTRSRVLQRQQNQGQNSFLPLPYLVNKSWMVGSVRKSLGTGVFIPRVAATIDVRKKQCVKNGDTEQRRPVKKVAVGVELNPSPVMGLPQEWTY